MSSPRYAAGTNVGVDKSKAEIEKNLVKYGADGFSYKWLNREGVRVEVIEFIAGDPLRQIRFKLPMPHPDEREFTHTPSRGNRRSPTQQHAAWEQACRQRWRALNLAIKAKLEAVECDISTFEQEFFAHVVDPNTNVTLYEQLHPAVEMSYQGHTTLAIGFEA